MCPARRAHYVSVSRASARLVFLYIRELLELAHGLYCYALSAFHAAERLFDRLAYRTRLSL